MAQRTIRSPGVEIRESDLTLGSTSNVGTSSCEDGGVVTVSDDVIIL